MNRIIIKGPNNELFTFYFHEDTCQWEYIKLEKAQFEESKLEMNIDSFVYAIYYDIKGNKFDGYISDLEGIVLKSTDLMEDGHIYNFFKK